jgi:glycosyltransferase involved in cell wall biosynthesis
MKIAIMMRAIDQPTGYRSYMEGAIGTLLRIDQENEYLLLYRKPDFLGRFSGHKNVKEMLIGPSHVLLWDQIAVPLAARRERADVIFHPKFTVPLLTTIPTVMVLTEPTWWVTPGHHPWWDVAFMRMALPLYCRKARHFLPLSEFMIADVRKYLKLPLPNATVTYSSVKPHFRKKIERSEIAAVRAKYALPERYILCVADVLLKVYKRPVFSPTKNVEGIVRAFALCRHRIPHGLVIAGSSVRESLIKRGLTENEFANVQFLGFVPDEVLPPLFSGADLFALAPFYEASVVVLIEAMTCGCPILTSNIGGCPEIVGDAALQANPRDPSDLAENMVKILTNDRLRAELHEAGLRRAEFFSWERTASKVLEGIRKAANRSDDPADVAENSKDSQRFRTGSKSTPAWNAPDG